MNDNWLFYFAIEWDNTSSFRSYYVNISPLFISAILFNDFISFYFPLNKLNYGVYYIQLRATISNKEGSVMKKPNEYFQSVINHEIKAMRKTPNEKLTWRKIIILWLNFYTTNYLIKE
jgi:hypothetical protein